ncbi:MAG: GNAT family N-acetyltransferase [Oscillatoria sp. PMC 1068.18]|nr:GNAT family N-acetyltransferase [Oscillatoria sp. PMC 1068.18]
MVGTGTDYPGDCGENRVEIRKMYLLPTARGRKLGKYLLSELEVAIVIRGYKKIRLEIASVRKEAVN